MGRPERHDVDYFPFYVKDGRTLNILESKYKCKGTGFFTNLFRFLSERPDHHFCVADPGDLLWFLSRTHCDEESALDMIEMMVKTGKLDSALWVSYKVIASEAFLDSLKDAYRNRKNKIITLEKIKAIYKVSNVRNTQGDELTTEDNQQDGVSDVINPQTKVKYSKVNNNCPQKHIVDLWHSLLPELPKVKEWDETRQTLLRARWNENQERQSLEWWTKFFQYIRKCPFLMGQVDPPPGRKVFLAKLPWVLKKANLLKIIEGDYE